VLPVRFVPMTGQDRNGGSGTKAPRE